MKNSFLKEFNEREYFNQCTNLESLSDLMDKKKNKGLYWFRLHCPKLTRWKFASNYVFKVVAKTWTPANYITWRGYYKNR